jgi:tetratricopeptide (TPR) repeat protein
MPTSSVPQPPDGPRRVIQTETGGKRRRRLRDLDAAQRAMVFQAVGWGGIPGAVIGAFVGWFLTLGQRPPAPAAGILLGAAFLATVATVIPILLAGSAGRAVLLALGSSGHASPRRKEYSFAQSLVARGLFEKAIAAYEEEVARDPRDPEAYLRIARILKDDLGRLEEAAAWFRRARRDADMAPGQDLRLSRELVGLYRDRMGRPEKALPELARMADRFGSTPDGEWAVRELAEWKKEMAGPEGSPSSPTPPSSSSPS